MSNGRLFVISAPSGAGKTTLCNMAVDHFERLRHSVSYTTRAAREGETNGVEYNFVSNSQFDEMLERGDFLENALVHDNRYGTSASDLEALIKDGIDVMVEIDVQGAAQIKKKLDKAVFIFILPPTKEVCEERLRKRKKDPPDVIDRRIKKAESEIKEARHYEYVIINDDLDKAFEGLKSIIIAQRHKREVVLPGLCDLFDFG